MTKDGLLNGLNNILNTFLYGLVCPHLVTPEAWKDVSSRAAVFRGRAADVEIELGPLSKRILDPSLQVGFNRNYENSLLRALIRESHELILLYCHETSQSKVYQAEPWFQFVRILRNVVSHKDGGCLREWPPALLKRGITSVSWRGRRFDVGMLGSPVIFYPPEGLDLLRDQIEFVEHKLT